MKPITNKRWTLVDQAGTPCYVGQIVTSFRGEQMILDGGTPPHREGSTGRIYTGQVEFFPSVCNLKWVKEETA